MKNYTKTGQFGVIIALLLSVFSTVAIAGKYEVIGSKNYFAKIKVHSPIDVNLEVSGVKLDSIFFDKNHIQAFVILRNRTPVSVNPTVGVSVFDKAGKMIASGIDISEFSFTGDGIDPGEQKNIKLGLNKFISDFKDADSFQLVFSLGREITTGGGDSRGDEDDY